MQAFLKLVPLPTIGATFRLLLIGSLLITSSCSDHLNPSPTPSAYPADVALSWMNMQLRLIRTTPLTVANALARPIAYSGIAGYESVVPGMTNYKSLAGQLNGLTGLPVADQNQAYNWPSSANAALAAINRNLFANTTAANKAAIDSLETAINVSQQAGLSSDVINRSVTFGQQVAAAVFAWAQTDGYNNPATYTLPTGAGLWVPTPPAFGAAAFPFWGNRRPLVAGSLANTDPGPPPAYSETVGSPFYVIAKEVYDIAQTLTAEQRAIALFWGDAANGQSFTPPGHWLSILSQVVKKESSTLDRALMAYAKVGIYANDALIGCFYYKYTYNLMRPATYIRTTLGQPTWTSLVPTPGYPEYLSGHATLSAAAAQALTELYGLNYAFTDQNYAQFGLGIRSFTSFEQAAIEAGVSRVYGGIHYRISCDKGQIQGKQAAQNIKNKLVFN
jgi:hypothetical protein